MGLTNKAATLAVLVAAALGLAWQGCGGGGDEEEASTQAAAPRESTTTTAAEDETRKDDSKPAARKPRRAGDETGQRARPSRELTEKAARLQEQLIETIRDNRGDFERGRERRQRIRKKLQKLRRSEIPAGLREERRQELAERQEEKEAGEDEREAEDGDEDRRDSD